MELLETDFVSAFIFAILCSFLLYCVVGEVYVLVCAVFMGELVAGGSDVSGGVEVSGDEGGGSHQDEASDIEFSAVEEKRGDVLLNYVGPVGVFGLFLFDVFLHLFCLLEHFDS